MIMKLIGLAIILFGFYYLIEGELYTGIGLVVGGIVFRAWARRRRKG